MMSSIFSFHKYNSKITSIDIHDRLKSLPQHPVRGNFMSKDKMEAYVSQKATIRTSLIYNLVIVSVIAKELFYII